LPNKSNNERVTIAGRQASCKMILRNHISAFRLTGMLPIIYQHRKDKADD